METIKLKANLASDVRFQSHHHENENQRLTNRRLVVAN